ncbi:MAG: slipin family protein [Planctomycetota bacterium]
MWKSIRIRKNEVGLWYRHGDLYRVLRAGRHWVPAMRGQNPRDRVDIVDTLEARFESDQLRVLKSDKRLSELMTFVQVSEGRGALVWVDGNLDAVLGPGLHAFWTVHSTVQADVFEPGREARFQHPRLAQLTEDERLGDLLEFVDLTQGERALVWVDGRLDAVLSEGLHAYWKRGRKITVERSEVSEFRFEHDKLEGVLASPGASKLIASVSVEPHERAMLFRGGELVEQLGPGRFAYWLGGPSVSVKLVDLREQVEDIQGQDIMTADKVTLRVNLVLTFRVTDLEKAVNTVGDWSQTLYREAQLELRAAVGGRTLEKLLSDKDEVGSEIRNRLAKRAAEFGVSVNGVGLRDLILPGDMKTILNEVIIAQKQAEANLIRRREETAAARSQVNTAKLLAENPVLARMREFEALQEILKGTKATFVLGSGDLKEQIGSLVRQQAAGDET